jgi:uncharacterized membrane protein YeaQ/YmgE (transglycosylase-associated protein family)
VNPFIKPIFLRRDIMDITLTSLVVWALIGLIAGWLAGEITKGRGFGVVGNIVIGIVGAILGGILLGLIGVDPGGFVGEVIQALIGALVLLAILGAVRR